MACGEFSLIARYFDRVKAPALMLKPASAMTARSCIFPRKTLAISTDTPVAGNHSYPISTLPTSLIKRWR